MGRLEDSDGKTHRNLLAVIVDLATLFLKSCLPVYSKIDCRKKSDNKGDHKVDMMGCDAGDLRDTLLYS